MPKHGTIITGPNGQDPATAYIFTDNGETLADEVNLPILEGVEMNMNKGDIVQVDDNGEGGYVAIGPSASPNNGRGWGRVNDSGTAITISDEDGAAGDTSFSSGQTVTIGGSSGGSVAGQSPIYFANRNGDAWYLGTR